MRTANKTLIICNSIKLDHQKSSALLSLGHFQIVKEIKMCVLQLAVTEVSAKSQYDRLRIYNKEGYDIEGYNIFGLDREGYDRAHRILKVFYKLLPPPSWTSKLFIYSRI